VRPPQPEAPPQAQRLRKGGVALALAASAVTVAITLLVEQAGYIPAGAAATYGVAVAVICAAFYALFATGLNRKFADPSLTAPLLVAAGVAVSYVAYHGAEARAAFMAMYVMAFSFGVFTLRLRGLVAVAVFYLACYAAVAGLSLLWRPELTDVRRELFRMIAFAVVLGWMAYMGSYVASLRETLRLAAQQLRAALERAEALAQRDGLTGAYNRRHMMSLLAVEAARAQRGASLSLCLADMDNFKEINDTYGHLAGDAVLRQFAAMANAQLRATDFVARFGGEEFLPTAIWPATRCSGSLPRWPMRSCAPRTSSPASAARSSSWRCRRPRWPERRWSRSGCARWSRQRASSACRPSGASPFRSAWRSTGRGNRSRRPCSARTQRSTKPRTRGETA